MITLGNAVSSQKTALQQAIVEIFTNINNIVRYIPVYTVPIGTFECVYKREKSLPTTGFRSLNSNFTASQTNYEKKVCQLQVFGGTVDVDVQLNTPEEKTKQMKGIVQSGAATLQSAFFDGSASDGEFSGINEICTGENAYEVPGTLATYPNGLQVLASADNASIFLRSLLNFLPKIKGRSRVLAMSETMANVIELAAYKSGISVLSQMSSDIFGTTVTAVRGIPILIITEDKDEIDILGFDETVGGSTDCGSLYCMNLDPEQGVTFIGQGVSDIVNFKIFDETRTGSQNNMLLEVVLGLASKRSNGVRRMYGIRNS